MLAGDSSSYAATALDRAASAVASAGPGNRNHELNSHAYSIGRLVGGEVIPEPDARERLEAAALEAGLSRAEARATLASALAAGMKNPRTVAKAAPSPAEAEAQRQRAEQRRRQAEREQARAHADAAIKARRIWTRASAADPDHGYLEAKAVPPLSARQWHQALVLPVVDFRRHLTSLQFIEPDGGKKLLSGGRKQGCVIPVAGKMPGASRVFICEGWATGASLHAMEPEALVLAAIDSGNLEPVATRARRCWPDTELVVCGDADPVGEYKARGAAIAAEALVAIPKFPPGTSGSDFNDLANSMEVKR
jgi:putative DNA primase/helicase